MEKAGVRSFMSKVWGVLIASTWMGLDRDHYDLGLWRLGVMTEIAHANLSELAIISVTFHPELEVLRRQLRALPIEAVKIIVDNNSEQGVLREIRRFVGETENAYLVSLSSNLGLASALNIGVKRLRDLGLDSSLLLLLDQDSEPLPGSIDRLCSAFEYLERSGCNPGAVGPQLQDVDTGLFHGFHQPTFWRWRRVYPAPEDHSPISIVNINGSGIFMRRELYERLSGMDEALFIDHVDTEWSFRLISKGYTLWGIPDAVFLHRMGNRSVRFWAFGWRVWPDRPPSRNRYLFRNAVWLMKRPYVFRVWKVWAVMKLVLTAAVHGLFDSRRASQLVSMWRGVREGVRQPFRR